MTATAGRTILITGANAGIGKDAARQLALRADTAKVYLACRNAQKAAAARKELETATGRAVFEVVVMDVTDLASVRAAVAALDVPVDALILNAGGNGGPTPMTLTPDGVTQIFASNVLGHVVLAEGLINAGKLTEVAVLVGSEAARGIKAFRMKRPAFATSSAEEFASVIGGTYSGGNVSTALAYGHAKYLGALWMSALARRHPELRLLTVSPGNTAGTQAMRDMPAPQRFLITQMVMRVAPLLGMAHPLEAGSRRIVEATTDTGLRSGVFYASKATTLTGPLIDQADIFPDLRDPAIQDNAYDAIHRYIA